MTILFECAWCKKHVEPAQIILTDMGYFCEDCLSSVPTQGATNPPSEKKPVKPLCLVPKDGMQAWLDANTN